MNFFYEGGWSVVKNLLKMVESLLLREAGAGAVQKRTGSARLMGRPHLV